MIRNMSIRSKLIAILVTPLIALTVLAFLGIGSNVTRGVQADRVDRQTAFAVNLSQLVHELQRERDLSAGWIASDRGYGSVVAQRVAVNQALADFRADAAGLDFETKIFVKEDAPDLLRRELAHPSWRGEPIVMSATTDIYQPVEHKLRLARRCLEVLAECAQPVSTMTKSALVLRDGTMPGRLWKVFHHYKRDEWESYLAAVTDWERDQYLEVLP